MKNTTPSGVGDGELGMETLVNDWDDRDIDKQARVGVFTSLKVEWQRRS
ncbi:MAG: hypothetical protein NPIRA02_01260 [Nitrospirales bacterium]|nr:MAG: hypothetical protein NPIRA02_01260 [Nitrospirales bacterium]